MVYVYVSGVLINSHLTWKYHISHVTSKISRNNGIIARLRHFTPDPQHFNTFIGPLFIHICRMVLSPGA